MNSPTVLRGLAALCLLCVLPRLGAVPAVIQTESFNYSGGGNGGLPFGAAGIATASFDFVKWSHPETLGSVVVDWQWSVNVAATEVNPGGLNHFPTLTYTSDVMTRTDLVVRSDKTHFGTNWITPEIYRYQPGEEIALNIGERHTVTAAFTNTARFVITDQSMLAALTGPGMGSVVFTEYYFAQSKWGQVIANGTATVGMTFVVTDTGSTLLLFGGGILGLLVARRHWIKGLSTSQS